VRQRLDDLTHDAGCVDYRLPDRYAVVAADVQHDAPVERTRIDFDQARELRAQAQAVLHVEEALQTLILFPDRCVAIQRGICEHEFASEFGIFLCEPAAVGQREPRVVAELRRQRGNAVDRLDGGAERPAHGFDIAPAVVGDHQHDRDREIEGQLQRAQCAVGEQRRSIIAGDGHCGKSGLRAEG
jgi:hypothetical protein